MTLNSGRYRRARDQRAIVIKRELLVRDGNDDLEWPLRRGLRSGLLRQFRLCVPVVVLVPERSVFTRPRPVVEPRKELSVCGD
jgi:hypothetical protein